jgi:hypothetical protein
MNCAEVNQHFEAALDEALDAETKKSLMLHVRTCSSCQAAWTQMQALRSVLQASALPAPSSALDERVMRAFNRSHGPRAVARLRWWQPLASGSISIPRPIFASGLVVFALALALATYVGRLTATQISVASLPPTVKEIAVPAPPQIVYLPVKVGQENREHTSFNAPKHSPMPRRTKPENSLRQTGTHPPERFMLVSTTGANYTTNATLNGFEPLPSATVRVIKGKGE